MIFSTRIVFLLRSARPGVVVAGAVRRHRGEPNARACAAGRVPAPLVPRCYSLVSALVIFPRTVPARLRADSAKYLNLLAPSIPRPASPCLPPLVFSLLFTSAAPCHAPRRFRTNPDKHLFLLVIRRSGSGAARRRRSVVARQRARPEVTGPTTGSAKQSRATAQAPRWLRRADGASRNDTVENALNNFDIQPAAAVGRTSPAPRRRVANGCHRVLRTP
jgi:hypothetical protein